MKHIKSRDHKTIPIKGEITAKFWKQKNPLLRKWNRFIEYLVKIFPGKRGWILKHFYFLGKLVRTDKRINVICYAGLARVTGGLSGDLTLNQINKMLLGTGSGTPAVGDTQLFTEAYRNDTGSGTYQDNIVYLTAYYTQTEVTGTFTEFGNVIDGTATANTGYLWSHIAGLNWVKDNVTTLTIDCKYTFQSV